MEQIFNRISRITKSEMNSVDDSSINQFIDEDDDDDKLKRVIENLKKKNPEPNQTDNHNDETNFDNNIKLDSTTAFRILGIYPEASIDEIKSAYKQKIKEYHPDKVAQLGAELRSLAEKKTQEINQAYDFIRKLKNF